MQEKGGLETKYSVGYTSLRTPGAIEFADSDEASNLDLSLFSLTDEYDIYNRLPAWSYGHKMVCHSHGEYARDEDGDGFHEVHVNTI